MILKAVFKKIKKIIVSFDKLILKSIIRNNYHKLQSLYGDYLDNKITSVLKVYSNYKYVVHYKKSTENFLSVLCDKYGSDKGEISESGHPYIWPSHTYADLYSRLFDHCRLNVKKVFECGIGTNKTDSPSSMGNDGRPGASLRVWKEYFPNALIIGADIDKDILFEDERIKTFYMDQTSSQSISNFWDTLGLYNFDFMIDDGLHEFYANICLFENSVSRLSENGIYVIEDVKLSELSMFQNYFHDKEYQIDYINMFRPNLCLRDNNLILIRKL